MRRTRASTRPRSPPWHSPRPCSCSATRQRETDPSAASLAAAKPRDVFTTLDLALRMGDLMLSSGGGAADVEATMLAVARACGLRGVSADVTFTELSMQQQSSIDVPASILERRVKQRPTDYEELIQADRLVQDLISGTVTRD